MSADIRQAAVQTPQIQPAPVSVTPGLTVASVIPYKGMKRIGGETVAKSRSTAPHVTVSMEVDMTEASIFLEKIRPDVKRKFNTKLTYTDLLIMCVAKTLGRHPLCNASLNDKEILVYEEKNIGVAVALEDGLIVPVIKNADRKTLGQISVELKELANRCRTGKQTTEDLSDGTFTITNLGAFGVEEFDPIIVPPQSCILGVCKIQKKPVVIDDQVTIRPMMNLCLSFDHRVLDGVPAAKFLQSLKETLEYPVRLLI
jgi:pyruvate dehydrogenase E2 component (dihydrolipoamide acetyltransferase)